MKKLIAILVAMIVLVGAVFADDPLAANDQSKLNINAEITLKKPVYSLAATAWGTYGDGTNAALGNADVMTHGAVTAEEVVIGDDVLTEHDATVTFTITQTALSRVKGTYTLTVAATNLVITQLTKENGTKVAATDDDKAANVFEVSAAPTIRKGSDGNAPTNTTMDNTSAGVLAITYNGKKVAQNTVMGTFSYTWTHHEDAAAGDYDAYVTLTITSIN